MAIELPSLNAALLKLKKELDENIKVSNVNKKQWTALNQELIGLKDRKQQLSAEINHLKGQQNSELYHKDMPTYDQNEDNINKHRSESRDNFFKRLRARLNLQAAHNMEDIFKENLQGIQKEVTRLFLEAEKLKSNTGPQEKEVFLTMQKIKREVDTQVAGYKTAYEQWREDRVKEIQGGIQDLMECKKKFISGRPAEQDIYLEALDKAIVLLENAKPPKAMSLWDKIKNFFGWSPQDVYDDKIADALNVKFIVGDPPVENTVEAIRNQFLKNRPAVGEKQNQHHQQPRQYAEQLINAKGNNHFAGLVSQMSALAETIDAQHKTSLSNKQNLKDLLSAKDEAMVKLEKAKQALGELVQSGFTEDKVNRFRDLHEKQAQGRHLDAGTERKELDALIKQGFTAKKAEQFVLLQLDLQKPDPFSIKDKENAINSIYAYDAAFKKTVSDALVDAASLLNQAKYEIEKYSIAPKNVPSYQKMDTQAKNILSISKMDSSVKHADQLKQIKSEFLDIKSADEKVRAEPMPQLNAQSSPPSLAFSNSHAVNNNATSSVGGPPRDGASPSKVAPPPKSSPPRRKSS